MDEFDHQYEDQVDGGALPLLLVGPIMQAIVMLIAIILIGVGIGLLTNYNWGPGFTLLVVGGGMMYVGTVLGGGGGGGGGGGILGKVTGFFK
jgi:hypothetical protein